MNLFTTESYFNSHGTYRDAEEQVHVHSCSLGPSAGNITCQATGFLLKITKNNEIKQLTGESSLNTNTEINSTAR